MSWGWVDAWLRHIAREHELQIIFWSDDSGIVQYILPLHRLTGRTGFRSKKIMLVCNYGLECSDNLGCLRAESLEDASAEMTAAAIQRFFGNRSSISLGFLDGRYDFPRRLEQSMAAHGRLARVRPDAVCPAVDLPADWDEYLGQLTYKFRSQVRRSCRKITGDEPPHHKRVEADQLGCIRARPDSAESNANVLQRQHVEPGRQRRYGTSSRRRFPTWSRMGWHGWTR